MASKRGNRMPGVGVRCAECGSFGMFTFFSRTNFCLQFQVINWNGRAIAGQMSLKAVVLFFFPRITLFNVELLFVKQLNDTFSNIFWKLKITNINILEWKQLYWSKFVWIAQNLHRNFKCFYRKYCCLSILIEFFTKSNQIE